MNKLSIIIIATWSLCLQGMHDNPNAPKPYIAHKIGDSAPVSAVCTTKRGGLLTAMANVVNIYKKSGGTGNYQYRANLMLPSDDTINTLKVSEENGKLAAIIAGSAKGITVWNKDTLEPCDSVSTQGSVQDMYLDDKKNLIYATGDSLNFYDLNKKDHFQKWKDGQSEPITSISGLRNLIVYSIGTKVKTIDRSANVCKSTLNGHTDQVNSVSITDNNITSGSADKIVRVWEIGAEKEKLKHLLRGHKDPVVWVGNIAHNTVSISTDKEGKKSNMFVWNEAGPMKHSCTIPNQIEDATFDETNNSVIAGGGFQNGYFYIVPVPK